MRVEDHNGSWRKVGRREKLIFNAVIIYAAFAVVFGSVVAGLSTDIVNLHKRWRNKREGKRS
jgi:hypothetical protein